MSFFGSTNFLIEVSKGNVPGHRTFQRAAQNDNVGKTFEDITPQGGIQVLPSVAETLEIVSTSTDDDDGGIGANSVLVLTLDEDYEPQSQLVTMDGITPVTLAETHLRTDPMVVIGQGSSPSNVGDITLRVAGGGVTRQLMPAGMGSSSSSHYTVPAGKTIRALTVNTFSKKGDDSFFRSIVTPLGGAEIRGDERPTYQSETQMALPSIPSAPEKTDINFQAKSSNDNVTVPIMVEYLEIDNDQAQAVPLQRWF